VDSARAGEIEIKPEGAFEMSRFLKRAEQEVRELEAFADGFKDVDPATLGTPRTEAAADPQPAEAQLSADILMFRPRRAEPPRPSGGDAA
tara:strand:+ start:9643 stop:9912 length:270 start_codon:yes stop_codon:yes gene_type:complete